MSLRVFVTGYHAAIRELCDALGQQPEVELAGTSVNVSEASWALKAGQIDVVVHAIRMGALREYDLVKIKESTAAPIVVLAESPDSGLLEEALDGGVTDVLVLPQTAERVAFAARKAVRTAVRQAPPTGARRARTITVFSPKGGTGKTVISSSLAAGIAKQEGLRTLLLDLDVQFGDAAIMLGIEPERTLHDLATAPGELDSDKLKGYLTKHTASGADVLAAPLHPEDGELVTEQKVARLLEVAGPGYDVIIVDTSPSFHGPMLSALDRTDVLMLVCTPEVPTLKNVRLGLETLRRLSFPEERMKLVLNRADAGVGVGRAEVEVALDMAVSYELPNSPYVPAAVNQGTPLTLSAPTLDFSLAVGEMSRSLPGGTKAASAWSDLYAVQGNGVPGGFRDVAKSWLLRREATARGPA
jgi:pilus assembly protein CpaE